MREFSFGIWKNTMLEVEFVLTQNIAYYTTKTAVENVAIAMVLMPAERHIVGTRHDVLMRCCYGVLKCGAVAIAIKARYSSVLRKHAAPPALCRRVPTIHPR